MCHFQVPKCKITGTLDEVRLAGARLLVRERVNNKMKIFWGVDKLGVENATSWWRGRHVTQPSLPYPGASTVGLTGAGQEW